VYARLVLVFGTRRRGNNHFDTQKLYVDKATGGLPDIWLVSALEYTTFNRRSSNLDHSAEHDVRNTEPGDSTKSMPSPMQGF
jgi:hypothetical protein